MMQTTLKREIRCSGVGLHSGKTVEMLVRPAPADTGVVFAVLLNGSRKVIKPEPSSVIGTGLATIIGNNESRVSTVEHLLASFLGLEIDNAIVEINADELPIMDGSASAFVHLLQLAGIRFLGRPRRIAKVVRKLVFAKDGKQIVVEPYNGLRIDYEVIFSHPQIGRQEFVYVSTPMNFIKYISRARTFGFLKDVDYLQKSGLALGGSLDNAIVFDEYGPINPEGLRFPDEIVRHKILDFMGDIAVGMPRLWGHFRVSLSGHEFNNKFLRYLCDNSSDYLDIVEIGASRRPEPLRDPAPLVPVCPLWA